VSVLCGSCVQQARELMKLPQHLEPGESINTDLRAADTALAHSKASNECV
jgi:hypothetical protein